MHQLSAENRERLEALREECGRVMLLFYPGFVSDEENAKVRGTGALHELLHKRVLADRCDHCNSEAATGTKLRRCGNCKTVRYCSVTCQRIAWRSEGHKEACRGEIGRLEEGSEMPKPFFGCPCCIGKSQT
jgi:hypothetical protein